MAERRGTTSLGPYIIRVQAGEFLLPNDVAQAVENLYPMEDGTLRTVWGPASAVTEAATGVAPTSSPKMAGTSSHATVLTPVAQGLDPSGPVYGELHHGIYHCMLRSGERDVLLLHTSNELWEFQGWQRNWRRLLSSPAVAPGIEDVLIDDSKARAPTQFEATGNGVIIVPQNRRSYFYDGVTIAPLGFEEIPSSPQGRGPQSIDPLMAYIGQVGGGSNNAGYAHDALVVYGTNNAAVEATTAMADGFGYCRLGNTQIDYYSTNAVEKNTGWLLPGQWRCAVQLIDKWGNLSALSAPGDAVEFDGQGAYVEILPDFGAGTPLSTAKLSVDTVRKQIAWVGIPTGPDHCVGRILYRTKDMINSGTTKLFELPQDATAVSTAYATLPDNITTIFPDNIPDAWLNQPPIETVPVPRFKLCRIAFGRLWIANIPDAEGLIRPSLPGRWGTFERDKEMFPDPSGGSITGLWRVPNGLMVFTSSSTYLITASDDGARFRSMPVSPEVGCTAPSSLASLSDGKTLWLGYDGFYMYDGQSIAPAAPQLAKLFRRITKARMIQACATTDLRSGEYRCWVSIDGSVENNLCVTFDGRGWRTRTDTSARDVCSTRDHRQLTLVAGKATYASSVVEVEEFQTDNGVYVLDHSGATDDTSIENIIVKRESFIETSWMEGPKSLKSKTAFVIYLWLRESENAEITVEVMRDWRKKVIETIKLKRYSEEDTPAFWGTAQLDSTDTTWEDRRPYWTRGHIYIPSAETFKFRIRGTGFWEFVGLQVEDSPRYAGGARVPP